MTVWRHGERNGKGKQVGEGEVEEQLAIEHQPQLTSRLHAIDEADQFTDERLG